MPAPNPISITTVDIANGVVNDINTPAAGTVWLESGFVCERRWLPVYADADLTTLRIAVVPVSERDNRIARGLVQGEHLVKVWLQRTVADAPNTYESQIDALAAFAYQIKDYWIAKRRTFTQAALANVYPMGANVAANYSPKDLDERRLWVGVVELSFHLRCDQ